LAKLRNSLLLKTKSDYVFSIDTDILFEKEVLNLLLEHKKDYVSGLICNGHMIAKKDGVNPYDFPNIMKKTENGYKHIQDYNNKGLLEVDLTGAIMLLSKDVCKAGRFGFSIFGEDAIFCESVKDKGYKIFCDTNVKCTHVMNKELLEEYKAGRYIF
jgi:hypothetical protein